MGARTPAIGLAHPTVVPTNFERVERRPTNGEAVGRERAASRDGDDETVVDR